jgi:hypothetical protein
MSFVHFRQRTKTAYVPANYNANEIVTVIAVGVGDLVTGAFGQVRTAYDGTTPLIEVGDGSDRNGYVTSTNADVGNTGLKVGTGAYLASAPGAQLYTAADTVDINYTIGATDSGEVGESDWWVWYTRVSPH